MTSRLETENGEIEPQMHNAGAKLRNEGNETPENGKVENEEPVNDEHAAGAKLRNEGNEAPENGEIENEEPVNDEPKNTEPPSS